MIQTFNPYVFNVIMPRCIVMAAGSGGEGGIKLKDALRIYRADTSERKKFPM